MVLNLVTVSKDGSAAPRSDEYAIVGLQSRSSSSVVQAKTSSSDRPLTTAATTDLFANTVVINEDLSVSSRRGEPASIADTVSQTTRAKQPKWGSVGSVVNALSTKYIASPMVETVAHHYTDVFSIMESYATISSSSNGSL